MTPHHTRTNLASDPLCAAIMLLIAGGYLLWYQHKHGKRITPTAIIWTLPFIASEIFVAALCVMRISDASNEALHLESRSLTGWTNRKPPSLPDCSILFAMP